MRGAGVLLLAAVIVPVGVLAVPANAAPSTAAPTSHRASNAVPAVGECFDLSDERIAVGTLAGATAAGADGYWAQADAVPCSAPHTFEVTEADLLPMDVNAFAFAAEQCGALDVWNAVGVNRPVAGIVESPLRIEPRAYAVRQSPPSYLCGAVAVSLDGRRPPSAVTLTSAIERLSRRERAALRYCSSAADGRSALAPAVTVPCSTRPRWQVRSWVMWTAFYDDYPGRAELRARASTLCGPDAVVSLPTAASWTDGLPRTWCYRQYP
jgi:hypothetical protein